MFHSSVQVAQTAGEVEITRVHLSIAIMSDEELFKHCHSFVHEIEAPESSVLAKFQGELKAADGRDKPTPTATNTNSLAKATAMQIFVMPKLKSATLFSTSCRRIRLKASSGKYARKKARLCKELFSSSPLTTRTSS